MRRTESSQRGHEGDGDGMCNSHCDTQHPVGAGRGCGDVATRLTVGQNRDRGPAGDENHQERSHATDIRINGMGGGCRYLTPGGVIIVWRGAEGWGVEGVRIFGPNVVSFIVTSGQKR